MDDIDYATNMEQILLSANVKSKRIKKHDKNAIGPENCENCGFDIPMGRRKAVPNSILCVDCQSTFE